MDNEDRIESDARPLIQADSVGGGAHLSDGEILNLD